MRRLFLSGVETAEGADHLQTVKRIRARLRQGNISVHSRLVSVLWVFPILNVQIENALSPEVFLMALCYTDLDKTPLSLEAREVDVCNAPDFDIVERQAAFYMNSPGTILKIGVVEVTTIPIQPDAQLRSAFSISELDMNIIPIDRFFE
jgi:hypothetical protein